MRWEGTEASELPLVDVAECMERLGAFPERQEGDETPPLSS